MIYQMERKVERKGIHKDDNKEEANNKQRENKKADNNQDMSI